MGLKTTDQTWYEPLLVVSSVPGRLLGPTRSKGTMTGLTTGLQTPTPYHRRERPLDTIGEDSPIYLGLVPESIGFAGKSRGNKDLRGRGLDDSVGKKGR